MQGSPYYCGHPEFELICNQNTTLFVNIGDREYQVNSINYTTRVLDLTDYYFASDESCPRLFYNTTPNMSLYQYTSSDTELIVYINCSSMFRSPWSNFHLYNISCLATKDGSKSFYGFESQSMPPAMDELKFCKSTVVVPLNGSAVSRFRTKGIENDFTNLLRQGFGLSWKVGEGWCTACSGSGGVCGYHPDSENGEACFCRNSTSNNNVCTQITASMFSCSPLPLFFLMVSRLLT